KREPPRQRSGGDGDDEADAPRDGLGRVFVGALAAEAGGDEEELVRRLGDHEGDERAVERAAGRRGAARELAAARVERDDDEGETRAELSLEPDAQGVAGPERAEADPRVRGASRGDAARARRRV